MLQAQNPEKALDDLACSEAAIKANHLMAFTHMEVAEDQFVQYRYDRYPDAERITLSDGAAYARKTKGRWMKSDDWGKTGVVADLLANAERVTKFRGLTRFEGFFREATGPGWVLVGDSGHFKDPTPGQGISDALRQVEELSAAIIQGLGNPEKRDAKLRAWWRWRDRDAIQHYWFCADVGKRGPISPLLLEIMRGVAANEEWRKDFLDIFIHRKYPRQVIGPGSFASAIARMLTDPANRSLALGEASKLFREDIDRRLQAWRPRFTEKAAIDEPHLDYQPSTEVHA